MVESLDIRRSREDISRLLAESAPDNLLLIGPAARDLAARYLAGSGCGFEEITGGDYLGQLAALGKFSAAIVAGAVECLEKHQAEILLSRIRDLHAQRFWLLVPIGAGWEGHESVWNPNDLIAFGMVRANTYQTCNGEWHLYQYDLLTYKTTPEWYGSRHWANPQMWDKKWW